MKRNETTEQLMDEIENRFNGALGLLRDLEWAVPAAQANWSCPTCHCDKAEGHAKSCELAEFLRMEGV